MGCRQWSYQVYVDVAEPSDEERNVFWPYLDVAVGFGPLTVQAFAAPGGYLVGKFGPDEPGGNETMCCSQTWVGGSVEVIKNLAAEFQWD